MKKLLLVCGIVATSFLFSSCLSQQSLTQNLNSNQTTVVLSQANSNLVDPLSNSLNEKCSRIREAFLREMDDSIACHYYITGDRATPKRIKLDRKLVE